MVDRITDTSGLTGYYLFVVKIQDEFNLSVNDSHEIANTLWRAVPEWYDFICAAREKRKLIESQGWASKKCGMVQLSDATKELVLDLATRLSSTI